MAVTSEVFRKALGGFASGVTVVTARDAEGDPIGVTVSAFCSLSLEPPLVLFCLGDATSGLADYCRGPVAISVLAADQQEISSRFARKGVDRFADTALVTTPAGLVAPAEVLARLDCTVQQTASGGDHVILICRVEDVTVDEAKSPLLYHRGGYHALAAG